MELLHKNRELVAWVALGSVALVLLSAFVDIAYLNDTWPGDNGPELSVVARSIVGKFAPVVGFLVAALATWFVAYWREPAKMASVISLVGLCLAGGAALLYLVFTLIGWGGDDSNGLRIFSSLLALVANLVALGIIGGFFYVTWKHVSPAPVAAPYGQPGQQFGQPGQQQAGQQFGQPTQQQPAQQQPTWQANEAAGGAWNRAGDAATGAGANQWGVPGQQAQGWQPSASTQPSAAEPQQQWGQPAQQAQPADSQWGQPAPQPSAAPAQDWNQPQADQPAAQPQNDWNAANSWAPAADPQPSAGEVGDEGTVLRPNPGQQWRPEDNNQQ